MQLRNNRDRFGVIAQSLHWIVAIGIIGAYCAVYYRHWFTEEETPENMLALHTHLSFGLSAGAFVILRIISRLLQPQPKAAPGPAYEHRAASLMHLALYFFMIAMPVTGYLGTRLDAEIFTLFTVTRFPDTAAWTWLSSNFGLSWEAFEEPLDGFHHFVGEWILWILVSLHVAAALFHHYIRRDNVLRRMVPGWKNSNAD